MKKLLLISSIVLLFCSCEQADYNYYFRIVNKSSHAISFDFNGAPENVSANTTRDDLGKAHYTALTNITGGGYPIKIRKSKAYTDNYRFITFTFDDVVPYKLSVENTLPFEVPIKAGNFIDNEGKNFLVVPKNDKVLYDDTDKIFIYTDRPNFRAVSPDKDGDGSIKTPVSYDDNNSFPGHIIFDWRIVQEWIVVVIR